MVRLDQFVSNLEKSGLVAASTIERAHAQLDEGSASDAAVRLARLLIQQGALTTYQARKVLGGATKGFFLGEYRILRSLGEGGMGKVYLAANQKDGLRVAIKVLPPSKAAGGGQALLRFRREMELSRRVRHPNLARTIDVGHAGGVHFMVLEYVPGESLYQLVKHPRGGPLRVPDAARFFLKVLDGLEAAHDGGLVHRDIKPSNLMVTPEGDARILDLGLARAMDSDDESPLTRPNVVIGTLDYASPEQLGNASRADRRSDLYSLGCTMYFALAGSAPFEGGDVVNKIFKQRMDDPEPLERVARGVPSAFAAIVRKLMAKDPDDRYQDCGQLRGDLARWADPAIVHAILGSEADAAHAFRPPPPELDEDDLRLIADDDGGSQGSSLRDLGSAEALPAPMRKTRRPSRRAVLLPPVRSDGRGSERSDEIRWLVQFIAVALIVGVLFIVAIAIFQWRS
jgi:eukaryotic-like serine/threonine-protein kinase